MSKALKNYNGQAQTVKTRQDQVKNNAGGFVFEVTPKERALRFLILGVEGGTFYAGERKFTEQNIDSMKNLIASDETMVRELMTDVATNNRAVRVSPTIFTAALLHTYGVQKEELRAVLPLILRTSTHLFEYAEYVKSLGGWGRSKRNAVKDWYESKTDDQLAYQMVKYRQRNGWTHADLLRLSHARPNDVLAKFALGKLSGDEKLPKTIKGFQKAQDATTAKEAIKVLTKYPNLPWEVLPTEMHNELEVWKTIFNNGSLRGMALIRNLTRLARLGGLDSLKDHSFVTDVAFAISDPSEVISGRLHPINYLNAILTYEEGQVTKDKYGYSYSIQRKRDWTVNQTILKALYVAFDLSFGNVEPSNKRHLIAVDVSGSMSQKANGLDLTCAQVAGVMAMVIARTEPQSQVYGFERKFVDLGINSTDSFSTVMRKIANRNFGSTDCSLPMQWAKENDVPVDTFVVITDNETYAGSEHPYRSLQKYRSATGIPARLAVLGVSSTDFTIADPSDTGTVDFVGFDAATPRLLADFSAGRI